MFSTKPNGQKARFDPFNLENPAQNGRSIKFERLPRSVKPRPLWLMVVAFILVLVLYLYLTNNLS